MNYRLWCVSILFALSCVVSNAHAQGAVNALRFYSDPLGTSCDLTYDKIGIVSVHMIHTGGTGSTGIQLGAITPDCWTGAIFMDDVILPPYVKLGNTQDPVTGLLVAFAGCKQLPIHVGTIDHFVTDLSARCCAYEPGPVQDAPLQFADCQFNVHPMGGAGLVVNPDETCPCLNPIPVAETTWGKVKALYR